MLLSEPQRVHLFPGDDMKLIELQEMVIDSCLWNKRVGSEKNRNHCAFAYESLPDHFIKSGYVQVAGGGKGE